jgi:NADH-quinone oxidoreductase subunit I
MKDSDVIVLQEPQLSSGEQFFLPQVLAGLGTTMKHMLAVLGGKDRVVQYPEERRED